MVLIYYSSTAFWHDHAFLEGQILQLYIAIFSDASTGQVIH